MLDKSTVLESLKSVLDPEIGRSIVELNMVRDVKVDGRSVIVKIALTVAHCPLTKTLHSDIEGAIRRIGDVESIKVETTTMTRQELEELKLRLQATVARPSPSAGSQKVGPGIERLGKKEIRSVVAIVSGKGGVGKSFVTSMLASELRRLGFEIGVLDADLTGPSIAKVMGVSGRPHKSENGGIVPLKTQNGIKVMSINLVLEDPNTPVIWRGPIVNSVIRQLYWDVDWGALHYLLVDLPPGTSDAPLTVFQSLPLDGVVVVSSPQDLASMIVSKAVNMAKKMNAPILGLIENMCYFQCPDCGKKIEVFGHPNGEKLSAGLQVPYLGGIPIDPSIARLSDAGKIEEYSNSTVSIIADKLRTRIAETVDLNAQELPIAWSIGPA